MANYRYVLLAKFPNQKVTGNNSQLSAAILSRATHKRHCFCSPNATDTELAEVLKRSYSSGQLRHRSVSADRGNHTPTAKTPS